MALGLDRIDSVPISDSSFNQQFSSWLLNLVDTLNEDISDIDSAVLSTSVVTDVTQAVSANSLYIPTNVLLTTLQLPDKAIVGSRVTLAGQGAGGWKLLTGVGQTIQVADVGGTATTSIASSSRYDSIEIICVVANTTWITLSTQTTGFVIV